MIYCSDMVNVTKISISNQKFDQKLNKLVEIKDW